MKVIPKHISYVMDASALIAVALGEPHIDGLAQLFAHSVISTCNLAEAANMMVIKHGTDPATSWDFFTISLNIITPLMMN
ncbi:MAG: hypothetical protein QG673_927 [Pseudomonadota bacterium]|nr:hypothetical protein [Pseudomonadota bacterium]